MKKYHIGYTCGVFDLFHVGHLNLLERCKEMCDILIVGVCDDKYVTEIKKKQPVYPEDQRVRILNALKVVDRAELVTIEETDDKMLALKKFGFDVLFSGDDWKGSERYMRTEKQFAEYGASIEYLPYTHGISTTEIKEIYCGTSYSTRTVQTIYYRRTRRTVSFLHKAREQKAGNELYRDTKWILKRCNAVRRYQEL